MAASLRADAAQGKLPHQFHEAGSYWASADQRQPVKVEETPEYKALVTKLDSVTASADAEKAANTDKMAALETKLADVKAAQEKLAPKPDRKTLSPAIMGVLAKHGLEMPGEEGGSIPVGKIDAALAGITDPSERLRIKTALVRNGVAAVNGQ
jgi:hypothetical protein